MRKMNLIIAALACVALCASVLTGFKSLAATNEAAQGKTLGGWEVAEQNNPVMINEKDNDRIETVLKGSGDNFKVLDLVATQVVSGANYMYLVYGTTADNAVPGYYFVTVYENTQGIDTIIGTTPIDVNAIQTTVPMGKGMVGGWAVRGTGKPGMFSDQNAQASFDKINNEDVMYNPIALLATQVVSGTNYKALCRGNDGNLYAVTWYNDLQNNASFTSAECVNIGAYSGL